MGNRTLEKIKGTIFEVALAKKKATLAFYKELEQEHEVREIKNSVAGYLQAMRDCDIITDRERMWLYLYYTQTKGGEC